MISNRTNPINRFIHCHSDIKENSFDLHEHTIQNRPDQQTRGRFENEERGNRLLSLLTRILKGCRHPATRRARSYIMHALHARGGSWRGMVAIICPAAILSISVPIRVCRSHVDKRSTLGLSTMNRLYLPIVGRFTLCHGGEAQPRVSIKLSHALVLRVENEIAE